MRRPRVYETRGAFPEGRQFEAKVPSANAASTGLQGVELVELAGRGGLGALGGEDVVGLGGGVVVGGVVRLLVVRAVRVVVLHVVARVVAGVLGRRVVLLVHAELRLVVLLAGVDLVHLVQRLVLLAGLELAVLAHVIPLFVKATVYMVFAAFLRCAEHYGPRRRVKSRNRATTETRGNECNAGERAAGRRVRPAA